MTMVNNINWQQIQTDFKRLLLTIPPQMGTIAVNFFKTRFLAQAWTDEAASPWPARKPNKKNNGRGILIKSGRLRNSPRIMNVTSGSVTVGTDVPYAEVHNEGFQGSVNVKKHTRNRFTKSAVYSTEIFNVRTHNGRRSTIKSISGSSEVKAHTRYMNMPQRKFIGDSKLLRHKLEQLIEKKLQEIFKK
jgi:phage gpG-like protein